MFQKKDESVIYKELMYRQINVNIIKEVLSFFEENSFGEDYHMSLEDEEISNSPDGALLLSGYDDPALISKNFTTSEDGLVKIFEMNFESYDSYQN